MEADASDEHPSDELPGERSSEQHYGAGPEAASHIADYSFLFDPSVQPISVQLTVHGAAKHLDFGLAMVVTGYMAGEKTLVCAYHTMGSTLDLSKAQLRRIWSKITGEGGELVIVQVQLPSDRHIAKGLGQGAELIVAPLLRLGVGALTAALTAPLRLTTAVPLLP
tara:strand:- start:461 stop:958 length:498 start_codon:yes stop_codon:yes gene_type:complete